MSRNAAKPKSMGPSPNPVNPGRLGHLDKSEIVFRKVDELIPFARNPRTHSEAQIAQIAASMKAFGYTNPVLIDETNTILAGDGRVRAARKLKLESVPCIVVKGLTLIEQAAYVIADNKIALNAEWERGALAVELANLVEHDFDYKLTGVSEVELMKLGVELEAVVADVVANVVADLKAPEAPNAGSKKQATKKEADNPEWDGMPEFDQQDKSPFRSLRVHFKDQAAVEDFAALIGQHLTDKTKYVWFPRQVHATPSKEVYA